MDNGSIPAASIRTLASSTNVPSSASGVLELSASINFEARVWEVWNTLGKTVNVYTGPDSNLDLFAVIPGVASGVCKLDRGPVTLSQGMRLSVRASDAAAIATGELIINFWR